MNEKFLAENILNLIRSGYGPAAQTIWNTVFAGKSLVEIEAIAAGSELITAEAIAGAGAVVGLAEVVAAETVLTAEILPVLVGETLVADAALSTTELFAAMAALRAAAQFGFRVLPQTKILSLVLMVGMGCVAMIGTSRAASADAKPTVPDSATEVALRLYAAYQLKALFYAAAHVATGRQFRTMVYNDWRVRVFGPILQKARVIAVEKQRQAQSQLSYELRMRVLKDQRSRL